MTTTPLFDEHAVQIADACSYRADYTARAIQFAIVSAHTPFYAAVAGMRALRTGDYSPSQALFGSKAQACAYAWNNRHRLADVLHLRAGHQTADGHLLSSILLHVPGLGGIKGGFLAQMLFGRIGCLDTRNCQAYGYPVREFQSRFRAAAFRRSRTGLELCHAYASLCYNVGGPAFLWDRWCERMHRLDPKRYSSAHAVSRMHVEAVLGGS